MDDKDDSHDEFMKAVVEYGQQMEQWERKYSVRGYWKISKVVRKMRKLADKRQKEIRDERNRIWTERKRKKAQDQGNEK